MYSSPHYKLPHLNLDIITLFSDVIFICGTTNSFLMVFPSLKNVWVPCFLYAFLKLSPSPLVFKVFKNACGKHWIQYFFKGGNAIKNLLVASTDKGHITKKSKVIYRFKCESLEYGEEYIGKSSRAFGKRFKEHLMNPSSIYNHSNTKGHTTTADNFSKVEEGGPELHYNCKQINICKG